MTTSAAMTTSAMAPPPAIGSRLAIAWTRCDGHGLCHALAPELIDLDEWGFPILRPAMAGATTSQLRRLAAACPALALRLRQ